MLILMQPQGLTAFAGAYINDHDILPYVLLYLYLHSPAQGRSREVQSNLDQFCGITTSAAMLGSVSQGVRHAHGKAFSPAGICSLLPSSKHVWFQDTFSPSTVGK